MKIEVFGWCDIMRVDWDIILRLKLWGIKSLNQWRFVFFCKWCNGLRASDVVKIFGIGIEIKILVYIINSNFSATYFTNLAMKNKIYERKIQCLRMTCCFHGIVFSKLFWSAFQIKLIPRNFPKRQNNTHH